MQWTYEGTTIDTIQDEYEGFVYLITNTTTGQKYIGKKLAKFKTTKPPLKARKINVVELKKVTGENIMAPVID